MGLGKNLLGGAMALVLSIGAMAADKADLIIIHGHIQTGAKNKAVQAVAVLGGHIIATGSDKQIQALATQGTQVLDLGGRTATAGLIETHAAISEAAGTNASIEQIEADILRGIERLHGLGVTSVRDPSIRPAGWEAYRVLLATNALTERVCVAWDAGATMESAKETLINIEAVPKAPANLGDGRLVSCGVTLGNTDPETARSMTKLFETAHYEVENPNEGAGSTPRKAAPLIHLGTKVGTLEVGKRADLAVWEKDPKKAPNARCLMTLLDGDVVYRANDGPVASKK
jgi:predicted amidohydrolase YtcJ